MKRFYTILKTELKLSIRGMDMIIFAICMPLVVISLLGIIFGSRPAYPGAGYTFLEQSFGAVSAIAVCAGGVMGLPLVISEYRQKKILKRYQVTPASPSLLLAVQTAVYTVYSLASLALVYAAAVHFFRGAFSGLSSSVPGCIPVCDAGHIQHRHDDRRHCPGCQDSRDVGQHTVFSHAGSFGRHHSV